MTAPGKFLPLAILVLLLAGQVVANAQFTKKTTPATPARERIANLWLPPRARCPSSRTWRA